MLHKMMKKSLFTILLCLAGLAFCATDLAAQNGNGNRNAPWAFTTGSNLLYSDIPMSLTVRILKPATDLEFFPYLGLNLGEVMQTYRTGECVITYLGKTSFRVELRGCLSIILLEDGV